MFILWKLPFLKYAETCYDTQSTTVACWKSQNSLSEAYRGHRSIISRHRVPLTNGPIGICTLHDQLSRLFLLWSKKNCEIPLDGLEHRALVLLHTTLHDVYSFLPAFGCFIGPSPLFSSWRKRWSHKKATYTCIAQSTTDVWCSASNLPMPGSNNNSCGSHSRKKPQAMDVRVCVCECASYVFLS